MKDYEYVDVFGGIFDAFGGLEEKKNDKKGKKDSSKSEKKNQTVNKKVDEKITLPATVYTGYREPFELKQENFPDKKDITLREAHEVLSKELIDYPEGISVLQKGDGNVLYLVHKSDYKIGKSDIRITPKTKFIFAGTEFDLSAVKTSNTSMVECTELENLFASLFPKFGKIGFIHSAIQEIIVPTFSYPLLAEPLEFPVTVGVFGRQDVVITKDEYNSFIAKTKTENSDEDILNEDTPEEDMEEILSDEETTKSLSEVVKADKDVIAEIVADKYPDFADGHLELQWNREHKLAIAKMVEKSTKGNEKSTKGNDSTSEEYFPTNATVSLIYTQFQLTPEMFGGKDKVEKEELRKFVEKKRPEFSKERTTITYDKKINYILFFCHGSRKGSEIVCAPKEAKEIILNSESALFDYYMNGDLYRVEKTDISLTMAPKSSKNKGNFKLFIPKIPMELLRIAERVFQHIYDKYETEALLQLFWDKSKGNYFWYAPKQEVTSDACEVERDIAMEIKYSLVAEFHSHASYRAFFSSTDDADELGYRIYGVIGSFHRENYTYSLRAGTGGYFVNLDFDDIFKEESDPNIDIDIVVDELLSRFENVLVVKY